MSPLYHRLEVYIVDFENYGIEDVITTLQRTDSYFVKVADHQTTSIPNWTDDHELNKTKCTIETRRKYFDVTQVGSYVDVPLRDKTEIEKDNERLVEENKRLNIKLNRLKTILEKELKDGCI
jgi:hypothetical protein